MQNILSLNTKRCIGEDNQQHYGVGQWCINERVYPIDNSNCVLAHQRRKNYSHDEAYYWVARYDVEKNREVWAYKQSEPFFNSDDPRAVSSAKVTWYWGNRIECIHQINSAYFMDEPSSGLCVRSVTTGRKVVIPTLGDTHRKSFVASHGRYLLLWNNGMLECYRDFKLIWKNPLALKPNQCFLHPHAGFVLFFADSTKVVVCEVNHGHLRSLNLAAPYKLQGWCETDAGMIVPNGSSLCFLDFQTGKCKVWAQLPTEQQCMMVTKTNHDYFVVQTYSFIKQQVKLYDQLYKISSRQIVAEFERSGEDLPMKVLGVGDSSVIFANVKYKSIGIYDIEKHKLSEWNYSWPFGSISACYMLNSFGKNRVLAYGMVSIAIIG